MHKHNVLKKGLVFGILFLFFGASILPNINIGAEIFDTVSSMTPTNVSFTTVSVTKICPSAGVPGPVVTKCVRQPGCSQLPRLVHCAASWVILMRLAARCAPDVQHPPGGVPRLDQ